MEGSKMNDNNIPSDEDFAKAKRLARERSRNLDAVNKSVMVHFKDKCPLHYFLLMPQRNNEFWAGIFFINDEDIAICEKNGMSEQIQRFVYAELERLGRGKREDIKVAFEFDSDENVNRNFDGDYFLRLR